MDNQLKKLSKTPVDATMQLVFGFCFLAKLFHKDNIIDPMKLIQAKLVRTLNKLADGKTVY